MSSTESITDNASESAPFTAESSNVSGKNAQETPELNGDTLLTAIADPHNSQTLYIWEEGNMPAITEYMVFYGGYADDPDGRAQVHFRS